MSAFLLRYGASQPGNSCGLNGNSTVRTQVGGSGPNNFAYTQYGNYITQNDNFGPTPGTYVNWSNNQACFGATITNSSQGASPTCYPSATRGWLYNSATLAALSPDGVSNWTTTAGMGIQVSALTKCKTHWSMAVPQASGQSRWDALHDIYLHSTANPPSNSSTFPPVIDIEMFQSQMDQAAGGSTYYAQQLAANHGFNFTIAGVQYSAMIDQSAYHQPGGHLIQVFCRPNAFADAPGTQLFWGKTSVTHDVAAMIAYFGQSNPLDDSSNPIKNAAGVTVTSPVIASNLYLTSVNFGFELNWTNNPSTDSWVTNNAWCSMQGEPDGPYSP